MQGGAHRFSKTPSKWSPPEVFRPDGTRALASSDILEVERHKYKDLWGAGTSDEKPVYQDNVPLDRATPAQIRKVARMFKRRTGVAPDG